MLAKHRAFTPSGIKQLAGFPGFTGVLLDPESLEAKGE